MCQSTPSIWVMRFDAVLLAKQPPVFSQHFAASQLFLNQSDSCVLPRLPGILQHLRNASIAQCGPVIEQRPKHHAASTVAPGQRFCA